MIGLAAGVVASLQALEAVKLLTGNPPGLVGALIRIQGLAMRIRKVPIERDPTCPVCATSGDTNRPTRL